VKRGVDDVNKKEQDKKKDRDVSAPKMFLYILYTSISCHVS